MNDATSDVAIKGLAGNQKGVALPLIGIVTFLDHTWNEKFTSSLGYSMIDISNTDGQAASAFKKGQYIIGNLMYHPVPNAMMGAELQYGDRQNYSDGWSTSITKVQFSFKYNFSQSFYK
jgi:hypothetical protein